jgi:hypothetical protein
LVVLCVRVREDDAVFVIAIDSVPVAVDVGLCDLLEVGEDVTLGDGVVSCEREGVIDSGASCVMLAV